MDNFMYIDTIRRPDGTLREWDEHDYISCYERACDKDIYNASMEYSNFKEGKALKDEERGTVQNCIQKICARAQWLFDKSRSSNAAGNTGPVCSDENIHSRTARSKIPRRNKKRKV